MRLRRPLLALVAVLLGLPALAQEEPPPGSGDGEPLVAAEAFVNANAAYEAGDYDRAIELYGRLLAAGYDTGELHYNLGNAYLRGGQLGPAIAAYRRSQARLPRDEDVRANLDFARRSTKDALAPPEPSAVASTLFFWHYGLSRAESALLLAVLNALLWGVLAASLFGRRSEVLRWSTLVLSILVIAVGASWGVHQLAPREVAVVVPQEIEVRSGTRLQDVVLFKLHAGTEVRVVDRREGALRIALPEEGRGGWIAAEHAEVVVR